MTTLTPAEKAAHTRAERIERVRARGDLEVLLSARGFRDVGAHAQAFVMGGYRASDLLRTERQQGRFPVSSPAGPLVRRAVA
jgi:hypothetical protein